MTASSLMSLLRLAHGVLGFLVTQPEERVLAFTRGDVRLAFVSPAGAIPQQPSAEPASHSGPANAVVPAHPADPAHPAGPAQPAGADLTAEPAAGSAPPPTPEATPTTSPQAQHDAVTLHQPYPPALPRPETLALAHPGRPMLPPPTLPQPGTRPAVRSGLSDEEAAAIAEKLRACETEAEGLVHLNRVAKNNDARKTIAKALHVEVTQSMTKDQLVTLILRHAIGARRTFAGLSSW